MTSLQLRFSHLIWLFAAFYFLSAVFGAVQNYSPVPYGDTWSISELFKSIANGDFSAIWQQHNEHRIIITKLLFLIDANFFGSAQIFLIAVNYIVICASFAIFFFCLRENFNNKNNEARNISAALILILLFSWNQSENLIWEFQSQFFLSVFAPLLTFYLIHRASQAQGRSQILIFTLACLSGAASNATMGNGIFALPLMVVLTIALRFSWRFVATGIVLSLITLALYFYDYHSSRSLFALALESPMNLIKFVLSYLGNPLRYFGRVVPRLFGLLMIGCSVNMLWQFYKNPSRYSSLQMSLLALVIYVEITAVITGCGRLYLGIGQSFTGRYTTPTLMAWAALLTIYAPQISAKKIGNKINFLNAIALVVALALLPKQLGAFESQNKDLFFKKIAALSMKLSIADQYPMGFARPQVEARMMSDWMKIPAENNWSFFGNPLIRDAKNLIGSKENNIAKTNCEGAVEVTVNLTNEENYSRIHGWIFNQETKSVPQIIHILNAKNEIIGYALSGLEQDKIKNKLGDKAANSGFVGYVLKKYSTQNLILNSADSSCSLSFKYN